MHETKRRHSAERRNAGAAALAGRAIAIARKGQFKEASRAALIAERIERVESKLRSAKKTGAAQHARAADAAARQRGASPLLRGKA